jgi:glycylpeptide N-tetradecanoyltransferase
MKYAL